MEQINNCMGINNTNNYLKLLMYWSFLGLILKFQGLFFYIMTGVVAFIGIATLIKSFIKK